MGNPDGRHRTCCLPERSATSDLWWDVVTLAIEAVTVRYGETIAVDQVTLTVATGEVLALVGPSGCGKSTLLRTIAGLVQPVSGQIVWQGRDITQVPTHQRGIGLMFQDHAL
ncbi:MAG: ATP-binding cassette domain-containing protein, partial [Acidimicrobiaceae bacterium]|nr:ATP-binding cassette domain-containing protein [Acidimicrobiaceae bacterium]